MRCPARLEDGTQCEAGIVYILSDMQLCRNRHRTKRKKGVTDQEIIDELVKND